MPEHIHESWVKTSHTVGVTEQAYLILACQFGCEFMNSHQCTHSLMENCNTVCNFLKTPRHLQNKLRQAKHDRILYIIKVCTRFLRSDAISNVLPAEFVNTYIYTSQGLVQNEVQVLPLMLCYTNEMRCLEDSRGQRWCGAASSFITAASER